MQLFFIIVSMGLCGCYVSIILYYRQAWQSIPEIKAENAVKRPVTSISVIIPARNEATNIRSCLQSLIDQSYPKNLFEILVVDDHSTDNTAEIVQSCTGMNIKLLSLKEYLSDEPIHAYKKKAIETAIAQSNAELIVTTDADCVAPVNWLKTMAALYEKYKPAFIAAPVQLNGRSNFIEIFQSLDFMTLQGITGASVHKKIHSMCNGANLAYERSVFYEVGGFKGIDSIASGDDMLLMHKIYKLYPDRLMFLKSKAAIVKTEAQKTIRSFFNQRIRWASKADKYDDTRIFSVLIIVYLFNVVLLSMPILSIFNNSQYSMLTMHFSLIQCWLFLLIIKTTFELFFLYPVAGFFNNRILLWLFPLMQPLHILYTVIAGWLGKFGSYSWKERKVK